MGRDVSMYAAAKLACEAFLPPFAARGGFGYLALRFGSIYGPDAAEHSNSWMMLEALRAVDRGEKARVTWSKDSRHSLVYVDDAARAVVRAIDLPLRNVAVNVVGEPASTDDIYSTLLRLYGANPEDVEFTPDRRRYQLVDNERLRTSFGCPPETSLEAGLQAIVNWHKRIRLTCDLASIRYDISREGRPADAESTRQEYRDQCPPGCSRATTRSSSTANGCRRPRGDRIEVVSPWSEEVIASVPSGSREDIDRAVGGRATSL